MSIDNKMKTRKYLVLFTIKRNYALLIICMSIDNHSEDKEIFSVIDLLKEIMLHYIKKHGDNGDNGDSRDVQYIA